MTSVLRLDPKARTPEPQSTQIKVLGQVSVPHPTNCEHQTSREEPSQQDTGEQQDRAAETADTERQEPEGQHPEGQHLEGQYPEGQESAGQESERQEREATQVLVAARSLSHHESVSATDPPADVTFEDQIASLERFSPVLALRKELPRIQISAPSASVSNTSLGTRVLNSASSTPTKEMKFPFGGGTGKAASTVGDSANPVPLPSQVGDTISTELPPATLPGPPVPLQLPDPAIPSAISVPGAESNPPHARKRARDKLKQKTKPKVVKVRKLLLRKKVLSLILGKELSTIIEPHLNAGLAEADDLAEGGVPVPAPTPL